MAQTREGALKSAAKNAGLTVEEYRTRVQSGLKRCRKCHEWRPLDRYSLDRSRGDGRKTLCQECDRVKERADTKGRPSVFKGRTHTPEARRKMSEARMGNQRRKGKPTTPEQRKRISEGTKQRTPRGAAHPRFIDGRAHERANRGLSPEDIAWRDAVYARDSYTCQRCGDARGRNLNAHHVKPWADFPQYRHDVSNGLTLCQKCHDIEHYGRPRLTSHRARRRVARTA